MYRQSMLLVRTLITLDIISKLQFRYIEEERSKTNLPDQRKIADAITNWCIFL